MPVAAVADGEGVGDLVAQARALIEKVVVSPGDDPDGEPEIELIGDLMALPTAAGALQTKELAAAGESVLCAFQSSTKGVPGEFAPPASPVPPNLPPPAPRTSDSPGPASPEGTVAVPANLAFRDGVVVPLAGRGVARGAARIVPRRWDGGIRGA